MVITMRRSPSRRTSASTSFQSRFFAICRQVGSIAKCESPTFAGVCPSETPFARTYRHLDLDQRRTLFRLVEARTPVGEIAARLGVSIR